MLKLEKGVEPYKEPKAAYVPLEIPDLYIKEQKEKEQKPAKKKTAYK